MRNLIFGLLENYNVERLEKKVQLLVKKLNKNPPLLYKIFAFALWSSDCEPGLALSGRTECPVRQQKFYIIEGDFSIYFITKSVCYQKRLFFAFDPLILQEKNQHINQKYRNQAAQRPCHVSKERWHFDTVFFSNGTHHKVWCVTNIRVRSHEYSTAGNRHEDRLWDKARECCYTRTKSKGSCGCKEYQIRWCIIQKTGKRTGCPEHLCRFSNSQIRSYCFQKHQCRLHGDKNTDK